MQSAMPLEAVLDAALTALRRAVKSTSARRAAS
jgi:hypothetical protein